MKNYLAFLLTTALLTACGDSAEPEKPKIAEPVIKPSISITQVTAVAVEASSTFAKFSIARTGTTSALEISFIASGHSDETMGSTEAGDYKLVYADGSDVGSTFELAENQNSRIIEVQPIDDNLHEVPETLTLTISEGSSYQVSSNYTSSIVIIDAENTNENGKVFIGYFSPQGNAITTATGLMSLVLQGDNKQALLSYQFEGLGSVQTDQHIHLAPSGTMIKDIEHLGGINNYVWDLSPGGPFTTRQQMLDVLFAGEFFINIHTAEYPSGEISALLNLDSTVTPPENSTLTSEDIDRDIIRFLTQATYGATPETYQALRDKIDETGSNRLEVYEAWIDEQMLLPQTSMLELTDATNAFFPEEDGWHARRDSFWPIAIYGKDQLRQRVAFALSEILVVGDQVTSVRKAYRGVADYWDMLASNAFGTYRNTIEQASRHAIMGTWLSHLKNAKANPDDGVFPDENYAREIMQLFSFGLIHRQANGAIKLGDDSLPTATYDNTVIKEMARVFTGLSFSAANNNKGEMVDNNYFLKGEQFNKYQYRWTEPMKFFTNFHDFGEKTLFNDGNQNVVVQASNASLANADAELSYVLDKIVAHPTTAPFIARRLIQRLVVSNPSADYINRVSKAFGVQGNLNKTIKAILLDPEARNPSVADSATFGKVKEPILRLSSLMRLLEASSPIDFSTAGLNYQYKAQFDSNATLMRLGDLALGQRSLGSDSVFNFFLPDFAPTGELASNALVSPELQMMTESQLFTTMNVFDTFLAKGFVRNSAYKNSDYAKADLLVKVKYDRLINIWQNTSGTDTDKATSVIDYLDFYLNAGQLSQSSNSVTYDAVLDAIVSSSDESVRLNLAVYGLVNSPEFMVQK
ncbi:DUF1800 family protein [Colwellia piezophila]|uniref:DUF1800 family protein n=1 Tax=Colwellia piezophila TaxID=211668 RepID=UPI00035D10D4|nr:DUF1800 family protein [Colwellia piezophila]